MKLIKKSKLFFAIGLLFIAIPIGQYFHILPFFQNANSEENVRKKLKENNDFLTCTTLYERTKDFLKYHYVFRQFSDKLSERTFETYIRILDPGKLYFTKSDIDEFRIQQQELFKKISNENCQILDGKNGIFERYKKRVQEASKIAKEVLATTFDFTKEEFIETDRKKVDWVNSTEELQERWRKTIKFSLLNMKDSDEMEKIKKRLSKRYNIMFKDIENHTTEEIYAQFLNAFALSLDPHSTFLTPVDNAQFQMDFSLKFFGIGATLKSMDGYTIVDAIVPGGAAAKDGRLKKNDKIVAVDPGDGSNIQDIIEMDLNKVVQLIRGKEGSLVKLVILRKETDENMSRFTIELKRAVVQIKDNEAKSDLMTVRNKKIGVINLPSFYIDYKGCQKDAVVCRSSSQDMSREIQKLKAAHVDGILIDLRRNGGGDLPETQKIVGMFIKNPVVTQVEDREKQVRSIATELNEPLYTGPLAILVSKYSASASEILSGAVQDYGRGLILGNSRTFGKGTVQTVVEVPGTGNRQTDGAIHVTIAKFFRPSGKSNQEKGVLSDIIIPDIIDATDIGEKENDSALPYTTIKPSRDFVPEKNLREIIPKLQQLSENRVRNSEEFKKILTAMEKVRKDRNTLVSLKETKIVKDPKKSSPLKDEEEKSIEFSTKVIRKNDLGLKEAAQVLTDSIELLEKQSK